MDYTIVYLGLVMLYNGHCHVIYYKPHFLNINHFEMEFIKNNKGGHKLSYDGHLYTKRNL